MTNPPAAGPDFSAPGFSGCYRHPERSTGISCQRCRKPICGECMQPASVGFQCPSCVSSGRAGVRLPRTRFGAAVKPDGGIGTKVILGAIVGLWVLNLVTRGAVLSALALSNDAVYAGQFWRLLTYGFVSVGLLSVAMNALVLWLVGRALESELGTWRFVALYVCAGLGGATVCFLLGPPGLVGVGASSALVGLLATNAIGKHKTGEDIRPDVGLLVLLVLISVLIGFSSFGWLGLVGGIAVGSLAGVALAYAPQQNRAVIQVVGLLAVVALCLVGVVAKIAFG